VLGNILLLLSGGLDSMACGHFLKSRNYCVETLFINYHQKAADEELLAASEIAKCLDLKLNTVVLEHSSQFIQGEIQGRNAFFISTALMLAHSGITSIAIGIHDNTPYYDCSNAFLKRMDDLVSEYTSGRIRLIAPFITWNKQDIFNYCKQEQLPHYLTYSCENGGKEKCGRCLTCKDLEALLC
jgi:7-cyano-7-deazaguanine synthase